MDERYFMYVEDMDWCRRFWQGGWEVWYLAQIELIHYHQRASAKDSIWQSLFNKMSWVHLISSIKLRRQNMLRTTVAFVIVCLGIPTFLLLLSFFSRRKNR